MSPKQTSLSGLGEQKCRENITELYSGLGPARGTNYVTARRRPAGLPPMQSIAALPARSPLRKTKTGTGFRRTRTATGASESKDEREVSKNPPLAVTIPFPVPTLALVPGRQMPI